MSIGYVIALPCVDFVCVLAHTKATNNKSLLMSFSDFMKQVQLNPLLGATWPIVYFLQGRYGRDLHASIPVHLPCYCSKHLYCEQPLKETNWLASATSKSVFILVLMLISYGGSIIDQPLSLTVPVPISISSSQSPLLSFTPVWCMDTANFINVEVWVCYGFLKHNIFSAKAIESFIVVWIVEGTHFENRQRVSSTQL